MTWGFPGGLDGKESASEAGDSGSIPGSGRSPEEGNGSPLQDSCLGNLMDRTAWRAAVHGVAEWDMTKRLLLGWFKVLGGTRRVPFFTPPHLESLHPFTASKTFSLDISLPGCFSALSPQLACYLLRKPSWNTLAKLTSAQLSSSGFGIWQPVAESSLLPVLQIKSFIGTQPCSLHIVTCLCYKLRLG